ncbi:MULTISPECIES: hypothetical protein [unclassified Synechococcus]|nr:MULTISPECIES: hypothetical protein [unclassified Synechococcus]
MQSAQKERMSIIAKIAEYQQELPQRPINNHALSKAMEAMEAED